MIFFTSLPFGEVGGAFMMKSFQDELQQIESSGLLRKLRPLSASTEGYSVVNGARMLNLSSNDYLGLAVDDALRESFVQRHLSLMGDGLFSASSSRLLSGNHAYYEQVESQLADMYGRSALFFNSGYHANLGILPALVGKDDLILSDKLVHASLIDGIQLSGATHVRYRHCDYGQLEEILKSRRHLYKRVVVVTESIFSMDGDVADLHTLVALKNRYGAMLYVDEAHAVGTRGNTGLGIAEEVGLLSDIDFLVGTMGKALASVGAFVVCDEEIKKLLINKCRTLIFTTALPPVNVAWSLWVLQHIGAMQYRRVQLMLLSKQASTLLSQGGFDAISHSNIIPVIIGDNHQAMALSQQLQDGGFFVLPVRPPTVPAGTARLRLSLSSDMAWEKIAEMCHLLIELNHKNA